MEKNIHKVGLFVPCCVDQFMPQTARRALLLLKNAGVDVYYPDDLTCCGKDLFVQGNREGARVLAERLMELYEECQCVVSLSSGCVAYVHKFFSSLFHNTTQHNNYRQFAEKFCDISDFLVNVIRYDASAVTFPHKVVFLDHCNTLRDYVCQSHPDVRGLRDEPRRLLQSVSGLELVEMAESDVCCGSAGLFATRYAPISDSLAQRKLRRVVEAGAEYVAFTEPQCMMHMQSYAAKHDSGIRFVHIVDILQPEEERSADV